MLLKSAFSLKVLLKYICIKLGYKFIIICSNMSFKKKLFFLFYLPNTWHIFETKAKLQKINK
jgi:hypothetical protein